MSQLNPDDVCMGVDIESGSPEGRDARYSLVVVKCSGSLLYKSESSSIAKLVRVAWEYRPRRLAIDNIYELGGHERRLLKILSLLPPDMEIYQVTLINGLFLDIRDVARKAGLIEDYSKLNPMKTAHVAALLACMGYGTSVRSVEVKTVIQVSKLRSTSSGGWSQRRYQRRVRAMIYNVATSIREALEKAGLDYDYYYRESRGGLESALFTVYAPIDVVKQVVEEVRSPDYVVKIRPVYRSKLLVVRSNEEIPRKPIIVGVDPGTATGLAIIDLDGRVLHLESLKSADRGFLVELISRYGKPLIIAVDVAEIPESVRKLASQLGANLYSPPRDLSVAEKEDLINRISGGVEVRDSHERDALAAAYKAYLSLKDKLEAIEAKLRDMGTEIDREEVKKWVLEGLTVAEALEKAVEKAIEEVDEGKKVIVRRERRLPTVDVSDYIVEIERLKAQKEALEAKVKALEDSLRDYERRLREIQSVTRLELLKDAEVERLRSKISTLERELEKANGEKLKLAEELLRASKLIARTASGELVVARRIPILTVKNVRKLEEDDVMRGVKIIIVDNPNMFELEALAMLEKMGVEAVLLDSVESPLANALRAMLIPALSIKSYKLEEFHGITLVERTVLEDAKRERERLKALRRPPDIEKIVEEYRRERRKLIGKKNPGKP